MCGLAHRLRSWSQPKFTCLPSLFFSRYSNNEGSILGMEGVGSKRVEAQCSRHAGTVIVICLPLQRSMQWRLQAGSPQITCSMWGLLSQGMASLRESLLCRYHSGSKMAALLFQPESVERRVQAHRACDCVDLFTTLSITRPDTLCCKPVSRLARPVRQP